MRFTTIVSGSSGNSLYIESEKAKVLVDAGLTGKDAAAAFAALGVEPREIDALIVTHEHGDHAKGAGVIARKWDLPVYATEGTWLAMAPQVGNLAEGQVIYLEADQKLEFADLQVEVFPTPHDAAESIGMVFEAGGKRVGLATDSGYVTRGMGRRLTGCEAIVLEANHDLEMLRTGPYPYPLKKRIAGDYGHLSNEACGKALAKMVGGDTGTVVLAHLSKENNTPEKALETVAEHLGKGMEKPEPAIRVAPRDRILGWVAV